MNKRSGFTIVELLVVIVVIGVLAAITIVSYSGISSKAIEASIQADLNNAAKKLKLYYTEYGKYPDSIDASKCPIPVDSKYCLKSSSSNSYANYAGTSSTFYIEITNGSKCYSITDSSGPANTCNPVVGSVIIGAQTWAQTNLDVGTFVTNSTRQTNNGTLEKWCYDNNPANCAIYGGLYEWDEAMQYSTADGAQGICQSGWHIPRKTEIDDIINYLGATVAGLNLKTGGSTGYNGLLGGRHFDFINYTYIDKDTAGFFWSSTLQDAPSDQYWFFRLLDGWDQVTPSYASYDGTAMSVRCIKN